MLQLISPVQLGRLIILAYPWFPDCLALTTWLAADAGDQQAAAFFSSATQSRLQHQLSAPFGLSIATRGGSGESHLSGTVVHDSGCVATSQQNLWWMPQSTDKQECLFLPK